VETLIWQSLWAWAKRRHPEKSSRWVARKYWHSLNGRKWTFAADTGKRTKDGKPIWLRLVNPADTKIVRYRRIKVEANPFDPNWRPYFEDRAVFKKFGVHLHNNKSVVKPASPQNEAS
jgi:RNA-directed DNA polymerase